MLAPKTTLVFLCTYQGIAFLDAQIRSILTQSVSIDLWVSDDGSNDGTRELVERYVNIDPRVRLLDGPRQGFVANFLSVFENPGVFDYSFLAFADQDDIWDTDKLARAQHDLKSNIGPALYGSATRLIESNGRVFGVSAPRPRPLSFANALVESLAGGNTMVLNHSAIEWVTELRATLGDLRDHWVSHDWMLYLVVALGGHSVVYDPRPTLCYRQHSANLVGGNRQLSARFRRGWGLYRGQFREMVRYNEVALSALRPFMTPSISRCFDDYLALRESTWLRSGARWRQAGLYRQQLLDHIALRIAFSLGRFP